MGMGLTQQCTSSGRYVGGAQERLGVAAKADDAVRSELRFLRP